MNIYCNDLDKVDSFESTYKNVLFRNNNLVIPYVNLHVPKYVINDNGSDMVFLNYCYIVLKDVTFLTIFIENLKRFTVIDIFKGESVFYFGGNYLDFETKIFNDIEVCCKDAFLQTLSITAISDKMWQGLYENKGHFYNLDERLTNDFWDHKLITNDIRELLH